MRISDLTELDVAILGFGREGRSVLDALRRAGHRREVRVVTDAETAVPEGVVAHVGPSRLPRVDVVIRSPGFSPSHPLRLAFDALAALQTTATNLFLAELRHQGLPVIGITGSKGKSTTSTLTHRTIAAARPAVLVGNIGEAALDSLERILAERPVTVMELSSYQCSDLPDGGAPPTAALLDLFPEHLDWHGGLDAYYGAKARIGLAQREGDVLRFNPNARGSLGPAAQRAGAAAMNVTEGLHFTAGAIGEDGTFRRGAEALFTDVRMRLRGEHNRRNAVAALALAETLGPGSWHAHLEEVLADFGGLPFRLEDEGEHAGRRFINDSISTAPEALAAALRAFPEARTLIAGGFDRGYDASTVARAIGASTLRTVITLPETGHAIAAAVRAAGLSVAIHEEESLPAAVERAFATTASGETVLFSPGAPSYNQYASFEERGKHLRALVRQRG